LKNAAWLLLIGSGYCGPIFAPRSVPYKDFAQRVPGLDNMATPLETSLKSILREFPSVGQAPRYPKKHYRRDRRVAVCEWREGNAARWRMSQIGGTIADLERMVNSLNIEIQAEQVRSGVNNPARVDYPTLATAMIKRRDNAMRSMDVLRRKLTELGEFSFA
jgi:hypothetical protein